MKKFFNLFLAAALFAGALSACNPDDKEETHTLKLTADKTELYADGNDKATFTVTLDENQDVTADAQLFSSDGAQLETNIFSVGAEGEYKFHATYTIGGTTLKSNEITITATTPDLEFDSTKAIKKNVAYFTWTGTWCEPCYSFKTDMKKVLELYGDNIVQLNNHAVGNGDTIGGHPSLDGAAAQLEETGRFQFAGYPTSIADLNQNLSTGLHGEADILRTYDAYIGNSPKTAVMATSTITDDAVNVTVTVGAKEAGEYSLGIFLVEDHIEAVQNGHSGRYDHTNVARQMGTDNIFGQPMASMTTGQTIATDFSFELLPKYKAENLYLLIYTLYEDGAGNMAIDSAVKVSANGLTGYNYAE